MKRRVYFIALFIMLCLFCEGLSCKTVFWSNDTCNMNIIYNDEVCPGDAVFVRLKKTGANNAPQNEPVIGKSFIELYTNDTSKKIARTLFYAIQKNEDEKHCDYLAGVPLSSYLKPGVYKISIVIASTNTLYEQTDLPLIIREKEFVKETIPLNSTNTAIKTDTSDIRMKQIEKLNKILYSINTDSVFNDKSFVYPTTATRRTSFFADRRIYAYSNGKSSTSLHYGIDYGVPTGTKVTSSGDGKVVLAENRVSTGWSVCIEHLPGLYSLYYHMSELMVKEGDIVKGGDILGLSGATGLATGPHLHWEIRLNGEAVSPDFFVSDFTFSQE